MSGSSPHGGSPRVLHIAAPGPIGGLESVVLGLAAGHRERGLHVEVIVVLGGDPGACSPFLARLRDAAVPVHALQLAPRAYLRERREVREILKDRRPDVVHTHGYRVDVLDSGVARRLDIPVITTVHGSSRLNWKTHLYERLQFRMLRRFDLVIAVTGELVPPLRRAGVPEERIRVVPNAWTGRLEPLSRSDARRALGLDEEAFVLGWVGRLIPVKGPDLFIDALRSLRGHGFVASIVGDGPQQEKLQELIRRAGLERSVVLHGRVDGAADLFGAFDAFVLSSRSEGAPMVLFEAMAAGVPIVAARVGGVGDIVTEREAWLVPPESPGELAAALAEAMSDSVARKGKAAAAAERLRERFGTERWLAQYETLYEEIAGGRARRAPG